MIMRVARHKMRVGYRRPPSFYDVRIGCIARLLRRAIQAGEQGLLESDVGHVRNCTSNMIRAYDSALQSSLHLSLTKDHCASIDEKSHKIELLRPRLEKKIACMNGVEQPAAKHRRPRSAGARCQPVQLFIEHCAELTNRAQRMRKMNAELMWRSNSKRSALVRAS